MITIQFLSGFSKRENSTKRFSGTVDMSLQGVLKEPCSIMNPVIQIERLENDINPCIYTYATITSFRRFYFVDDWVWVQGLWEVHLREDVLGTWKEAIGQQTEYILRTNSTENFNGEITDITYPATTNCETYEAYAVSAFTTDIEVGCYIVGIISGGQSNAVGAITYYAMSSTEFGSLKDMLFSDDNMQIMGIIDSSQPPKQLVQDLSYEVLKTLYNPYQYIASCIWFPFPKELIQNKTDVSALSIGWWGYPLSGSRLYAQTLEVGEQMPLHIHPQSTTRGSYLDYAPYSRRTLIGRFGTIALDSSCFKMTDNLSITYNVDLITGQCRTTIRREHYNDESQLISDVIAERYFLLGVPIQIAQVGTDYLGTAVSALNSVPQIMGSVGTGYSQAGMVGAVINGIASTATGIYNTLQSVMPQVETGGANGSFLAPSTRTCLLEQFYKIVDEDIEHRGRPLCELRQINTLSGFILCADGELDLNCFDNEREEIKRFLTTGFFWE